MEPYLPPEIICDILSRPIDSRTLRNVMLSSAYLQELAHQCVTHIILSADEEVSVKAISPFRRLSSLEHGTILISSPENVSQLPRTLREASFLITYTSDIEEVGRLLCQIVQHYGFDFFQVDFMFHFGDSYFLLSWGIFEFEQGTSEYNFSILLPLLRCLAEFGALRGLVLNQAIDNDVISFLLTVPELDTIILQTLSEEYINGNLIIGGLSSLLSQNKIRVLEEIVIGFAPAIQDNTTLLGNIHSSSLCIANLPVDPNFIEDVMQNNPNLELLGVFIGSPYYDQHELLRHLMMIDSLLKRYPRLTLVLWQSPLRSERQWTSQLYYELLHRNGNEMRIKLKYFPYD